MDTMPAGQTKHRAGKSASLENSAETQTDTLTKNKKIQMVVSSAKMWEMIRQTQTKWVNND